MTPEKAIKTIKTVMLGVGRCFPTDYTEAFEEAVKSLEKQIPKKPVIKIHKYIGFDDDFVNKYHCPVCNALIINEDKNGFYAGRKQKHCNCGQALDWSDT